MSTESPEKDIANHNNSNNGQLQSDKCNMVNINSITNNLLDNYNDKIPNYLNLACCVNGYSNLTTYDSKIRQDINKSREVSPIRPSTSSLQYCKQSNLLTPPTLLSLNELQDNHITASIRNTENHNNYMKNGSINNGRNTNGNQQNNLSFIQQRVELLYGREALPHVFYSPSKGRLSSMGKIHELISPSKAIKDNYINGNQRNELVDETDQAAAELPVFRHLNAKFRAQLPKLSPKRQLGPSISNNHTDINKLDITDESCEQFEKTPHSNGTNKHENQTVGQIKDGHYFLAILKSEQQRLLLLSEEAEMLTNQLMQNPDTTEDNLGILRSASGKAKLLATKKMKQFEGLCKDNISPPSGDKFQTTADDLQGFWDMVKLQVDHVDSLFAEINELKANNWQKIQEKVEIIKTPNMKQQLKTPGKNLIKGQNSKANTPMSASALKRETQRKQLIEMKRKNKLAMDAKKDGSNLDTNTTKPIEIFVNTSST